MSSRLVKAHLYRNTANIFNARDPETRRFNIDNNLTHNYNSLKAKVLEIFQGLDAGTMKLYWKDSDGDYILFSRDDELKDAVSAAKDEIFTMYIISPGQGQGQDADTRRESGDGTDSGQGRCDECNAPNMPGIRLVCQVCPDTNLCLRCSISGKHEHHPIMGIHQAGGQTMGGSTGNSNVVHPGISCNACDMNPLRGIRYHCMDCPNYDLCVPCQRTGKHPGCRLFVIDSPLNPEQNARLAASHGDRDAAAAAMALSLLALGARHDGETDNSGPCTQQ